jgi:hypothetical protein
VSTHSLLRAIRADVDSSLVLAPCFFSAALYGLLGKMLIPALGYVRISPMINDDVLTVIPCVELSTLASNLVCTSSSSVSPISSQS